MGRYLPGRATICRIVESVMVAASTAPEKPAKNPRPLRFGLVRRHPAHRENPGTAVVCVRHHP
jgi:hypothetical protein